MLLIEEQRQWNFQLPHKPTFYEQVAEVDIYCFVFSLSLAFLLLRRILFSTEFLFAL